LNTNDASLLRNKILDFIVRTTNSKKQLANRRFVCPYKINWTVSNQPLNVNQTSMARYYDYMVTSTSGFAFIARSVLDIIRKRRKCDINKQNGFADCSNCQC
jgi:hypothetical protein